MRPHMRHRFGPLLAALLTGASVFAGPMDSGAVRLLPAGRIFPRLHADGMLHRLGIAKDLGSRSWAGTVGGERPVLGFSLGSVEIQGGIGASVHPGIVRHPPLLQVVSVDFVVDFPVDIRLTPALTLRTGYGHISAHLADDGIEILGLPSINYAKDYFRLLAAHELPLPGTFLYAGARWDFHSLPATDSHWMLQCGAETRPLSFGAGICLYAAVDLRFRQEAAWRATQSYQAGLLLDGAGGSALRIAWTLRTGADDRGQFYRSVSTASLLGLFLDL